MLANHLLLFSLYFAPFDTHGGLSWWLFGTGIGTNIGSSIIWGFIAGFVGYLVAKRVKQAWVRLHARIDTLHAHHETHHEDLHNLAQRLEELHDKVDNRYVGNASKDQIHQYEEPEDRTGVGITVERSTID